MEALCCDNFFTVMKTITPETRPKLLKLLTGFLQRAGALAAVELVQKYPANVAATYDRFGAMARALVALLSPIPGHLDSSATDVNDIKKYKGQNLEESTLRDILTVPGDKTSPNPWLKMLDDLLSRGEATQEKYPRILEIAKILKAFDLDKPLEIDLQMLGHVATELPKIDSVVRKGCCDEAMSLLKDVLLRFALEIVKTKAGEVALTSSCLAAVQAGLEVFGHIPGVARACEQLSKWKKNSESYLALSELMSICQGFPEDLQSVMTPGSIGNFLDAWQAVSKAELDSLSDDKLVDFNHGLAWIMRVILGIVKVRSQNGVV